MPAIRTTGRRFAVLAVVAIVMAASGQVYGRAVPIPLDEKVEESDFIGFVRILEIEPLSEPTEGDARWPYRQLARAEILESLKGEPAGAVVELEFDNGLACPNATYETGREYLVFWYRLAPRRYATFNFYYGYYSVEDGMIAGWETTGDQSRTHVAVVAQLKKLLGE